MAGTFEGKVALVTGGAMGIGKATALAFAREGARVVISDVNPGEGEQAVAEVRRAGGQALFIPCDVSKAADVAALVTGTVRAFGRLDAAFNNAGIGGLSSPVADYADADWDRVMGVNLRGVYLCLKQELKQMVALGGGAIVNNASILGTVAYPNACAYVAAKHGVLGLTRAAALEYATRGIRINAVCPGFIKTPLLASAGIVEGTPLGDQVAALHPVKRLGQAEEVASAVLWLCSPGASFVTGHPLLVDGGYVAQ